MIVHYLQKDEGVSEVVWTHPRLLFVIRSVFFNEDDIRLKEYINNLFPICRKTHKNTIILFGKQIASNQS